MALGGTIWSSGQVVFGYCNAMVPVSFSMPADAVLRYEVKTAALPTARVPTNLPVES